MVRLIAMQLQFIKVPRTHHQIFPGCQTPFLFGRVQSIKWCCNPSLRWSARSTSGGWGSFRGNLDSGSPQLNQNAPRELDTGLEERRAGQRLEQRRFRERTRRDNKEEKDHRVKKDNNSLSFLDPNAQTAEITLKKKSWNNYISAR